MIKQNVLHQICTIKISFDVCFEFASKPPRSTTEKRKQTRVDEVRTDLSDLISSFVARIPKSFRLQIPNQIVSLRVQVKAKFHYIIQLANQLESWFASWFATS